MALQLFIVPEIGAGTSQDPLRAKYIDGLGITGPVGQTRYGFQPIRLVGADFTPAQSSSLSANSDVFTFPTDLSVNVGGGNVQTARDAYALVFIPEQWITAQTQWMEVAVMTAGMFQFMNRLKTFLPTLIIDDIAKLNIQWSSVPTDTQSGILACAQSFGYSTSFIVANTQIRTIIEEFGRDWGAAPIFVGPVVLQR